MASADNHPFPRCFDCKIYKGLCGPHAGQLGRKAGIQTEPYGAMPAPLSPTASSSSASASSAKATAAFTQDQQERKRVVDEEIEMCIDCKMYKIPCSIHRSKLQAIEREASASGPRTSTQRKSSLSGASAPATTNYSASSAYTTALRPSPFKPTDTEEDVREKQRQLAKLKEIERKTGKSTEDVPPPKSAAQLKQEEAKGKATQDKIAALLLSVEAAQAAAQGSVDSDPPKSEARRKQEEAENKKTAEKIAKLLTGVEAAIVAASATFSAPPPKKSAAQLKQEEAKGKATQDKIAKLLTGVEAGIAAAGATYSAGGGKAGAAGGAIMKCPECTAPRDGDSVFCGDCGHQYVTGDLTEDEPAAAAPASKPPAGGMTNCAECGLKRDPPDSLFCGDCGYRFPGGDDVVSVSF